MHAGIRPSGASRPYLRPARSIPLGVGYPLGYIPRRLPRPCLCPASSIPLGYVPRRSPRPYLCPARSISLGVLSPLGYVPRRPSRPCPCPASSISLGVLCTLGYAPRDSFPPPPTHSPALRPHRLHFLQLCHLVIQSTRTTPFCRPNTHPRKCTSRSTCWDTFLEGFPSLLASCYLYPSGGWCPRWDTFLGGLPVLARVLLAVSRWGCCVRWDTFLEGFPSLPVSC